MGQPQVYAHLGNPDRDRLGVKDRHAGYFLKIRGINHAGNQRAAQRDHTVGTGFAHETANQLGRFAGDFLLLFFDVRAVDIEAPDAGDEPVHAMVRSTRHV